MPRHADFSSLTHDELLSAVTDLVARKRITADEVRAVAGRAGRIAELERELAELRGEHRGPSRPPGPPAAKVAARPVRRKVVLSPKTRALRGLQGQYLGVVRWLPAAQKREVKALAKTDLGAAVKLGLKYRAEAKGA